MAKNDQSEARSHRLTTTGTCHLAYFCMAGPTKIIRSRPSCLRSVSVVEILLLRCITCSWGMSGVDRILSIDPQPKDKLTFHPWAGVHKKDEDASCTIVCYLTSSCNNPDIIVGHQLDRPLLGLLQTRMRSAT